jgi:hypothetical protein
MAVLLFSYLLANVLATEILTEVNICSIERYTNTMKTEQSICYACHRGAPQVNPNDCDMCASTFKSVSRIIDFSR